jgi:hypothetical protein
MNNMKPRYAVVNEDERRRFETKWQMPYGYSNCNVFDDYDQAEGFFNEIIAPNKNYESYVLEEYNNGERNTVMEGTG